MVNAAHLVFTCYGFWLPNDPRGSWSDFVRSWDLLQFGDPTKTDERRSLANNPHDRERRKAAKSALRYEPVRLTGLQAPCTSAAASPAPSHRPIILPVARPHPPSRIRRQPLR